MKQRHKSNINYNSHFKDNKSLSKELNSKSDVPRSNKVHFETKEFNKLQDYEKNYFDNNSEKYPITDNYLETENNIKNPPENKNIKSNDFDNSRAVTASFFTNNSTMTNNNGLKQIRRNRYNKTYSQIYKEKKEHSKSIDDPSNSNLNSSKKGNKTNNSNYENKKFDHSKCGHFKNKINATTHNCLIYLNKKNKSDNKILPTHSLNGSIDFDIYCGNNYYNSNYDINKRQNTQHSYNFENISQIHNKKNTTIHNNLNNSRNNAFDKNKNEVKSRSMNQEELRNNLLKIHSTSITPRQNFNMSSSIKNLLSETKKYQNDNNFNTFYDPKNAENDNNYNFDNNYNSNNNYNKISIDSPKSIPDLNNNYNFFNKINNNFNKSNKNNFMAKSLSSIESDHNYQSNFSNTIKSNSSNIQINNFDNPRSNHGKMSSSNENFYRHKNNKKIGTVKIPTMNRTDPNIFKKIKNTDKNFSVYESPRYAEKGDLTERNIHNNDKSFEKGNNQSLPQIKSVKFVGGDSNEIKYDYPKRDNNNSFFNTISSPNNSIGKGSNSNLKNNYNNSTSNTKIITNNNNINSIPNTQFSNENSDKNNLGDDLMSIGSPNRINGFGYNSPKIKSETKQNDFNYNNPRINSNNYNNTEGDQLTLIEEADEKIAGHISEENINFKDGNSIKNIVVLKNINNDKSLNTSKKKPENELMKSLSNLSIKKEDNESTKIKNDQNLGKIKEDISYIKTKANESINNSINRNNNKQNDTNHKEILPEKKVKLLISLKSLIFFKKLNNII